LRKFVKPAEAKLNGFITTDIAAISDAMRSAPRIIVETIS
jgi:hypothetical protein